MNFVQTSNRSCFVRTKNSRNKNRYRITSHNKIDIATLKFTYSVRFKCYNRKRKASFPLRSLIINSYLPYRISSIYINLVNVLRILAGRIVDRHTIHYWAMTVRKWFRTVHTYILDTTHTYGFNDYHILHLVLPALDCAMSVLGVTQPLMHMTLINFDMFLKIDHWLIQQKTLIVVINPSTLKKMYDWSKCKFKVNPVKLISGQDIDK